MTPAAPPDAQQPWWRGAAIYQVYPRSFADSNDDGIGDLPGITARLEHIASLGVDGVWLSPFFTSPMADFGYDVADYTGVDPMFGTLADFDALVARAHALGLKVIIDQVWSHTSDQHPWFAESRADRSNARADWYVWADAKPDGSPPNNWQSVFIGPAWSWDARRGQYYLHNFLAGQPDLNLHNPDVQAALLNVARFWLERGVDGFRLDAINFAFHDPQLRDNPPAPPGGPRTRPADFQVARFSRRHELVPAFLERVRALTDGYGQVFTVAEVADPEPEPIMHAFTQGRGRLNSAYGFLYLYADKLTGDMIPRGAAMWPGEDGEGWPSWTFSNHDAPRAVSRWAEGRDRKAFAEMCLLLLMGLRGNVFVYQGEELGLTEADLAFEDLQDPYGIQFWPDFKGRDGCRTPMVWSAGEQSGGFSDGRPWLPVFAAHLERAVDVQEGDEASVLSHYRRFLAFRKEHVALVKGDIEFLSAEGAILSFVRSHGNEKVFCAFNMSPVPRLADLPSGTLEVLEGHGFASLMHEENIELPAWSGFFARFA